MLLKLDLAALGQVRAHWRGTSVTVLVNWPVRRSTWPCWRPYSSASRCAPSCARKRRVAELRLDNPTLSDHVSNTRPSSIGRSSVHPGVSACTGRPKRAAPSRRTATVRFSAGGQRARRCAADLLQDGALDDSGEPLTVVRRDFLQPPDLTRLEPTTCAQHLLRILLPYGSLRERSYSRLLVGHIVASDSARLLDRPTLK